MRRGRAKWWRGAEPLAEQFAEAYSWCARYARIVSIARYSSYDYRPTGNAAPPHLPARARRRPSTGARPSARPTSRWSRARTRRRPRRRARRPAPCPGDPQRDPGAKPTPTPTATPNPVPVPAADAHRGRRRRCPRRRRSRSAAAAEPAGHGRLGRLARRAADGGGPRRRRRRARRALDESFFRSGAGSPGPGVWAACALVAAVLRLPPLPVLAGAALSRAAEPDRACWSACTGRRAVRASSCSALWCGRIAARGERGPGASRAVTA